MNVLQGVCWLSYRLIQGQHYQSMETIKIECEAPFIEINRIN